MTRMTKEQLEAEVTRLQTVVKNMRKQYDSDITISRLQKKVEVHQKRFAYLEQQYAILLHKYTEIEKQLRSAESRQNKLQRDFAAEQREKARLTEARIILEKQLANMRTERDQFMRQVSEYSDKDSANTAIIDFLWDKLLVNVNT